MTMIISSFMSVPRKGHLDGLKRICLYVSKMRHADIRIRIKELDLSALPEDPNTCDQSIYGNAREEIPNDIPKPLGKFVITTHYDNANLSHDIMIGRSVTNILHLIIKTPFDWYSKEQTTCETAAYGLDFVVPRTCTE